MTPPQAKETKAAILPRVMLYRKAMYMLYKEGAFSSHSTQCTLRPVIHIDPSSAKGYNDDGGYTGIASSAE